MLGKLGKILEFVGGLSIVFDIWGPATIQKLGRSLRYWDPESTLGKIDDRHARYLLFCPFVGWTIYAIASLIIKNGNPQTVELFLGKAGVIFYSGRQAYGLFVNSIIAGFCSGIVFVVILLMWIGAMLGIAVILAHYIAKRLERPDASDRLKIFALIFFADWLPTGFFSSVLESPHGRPATTIVHRILQNC